MPKHEDDKVTGEKKRVLDEEAPRREPLAAPLSGEGSRLAEAYTPRPEDDFRPQGGPKGWVFAAILTGALVGALAYNLSTGRRPPSTPPSTVTTEAQSLKTLFLVHTAEDREATDRLRNERVPASLPEELRKIPPSLVAEVHGGARELFTLKLSDNREEDGDIVQLELDGVSLGFVPIKHAPTTVTIPLKPHGMSQLKILAQADGGGGGVTLSATGTDGHIVSRPLQVGDSETWYIGSK